MLQHDRDDHEHGPQEADDRAEHGSEPPVALPVVRNHVSRRHTRIKTGKGPDRRRDRRARTASTQGVWVAFPPVKTMRDLRDRARLQQARRRLRGAPRPDHVGLVMDGNRRWARAAGYANPSLGHRVGAERVEDALRWCEEWAIEHLTIYVLSADNIRRRDGEQVGYLMGLIETVVTDKVLGGSGTWELHVAGDENLLPGSTAAALREAMALTRGRPHHLTLAIGYDGRADVVAGVRAALLAPAASAPTVGMDHVAAQFDADQISRNLGGGPVKDIDLVIRTGGELRISGFFPWQSAHAEIFVSPRMWPAFTAADFAVALAHYAARKERMP